MTIDPLLSFTRAQSTTIKADFDTLRPALWLIGSMSLLPAAAVAPASVWFSAREIARPFATLALIILGATLADRFGIFRLLASLLVPSTAQGKIAFSLILSFAAVLSAVVNLDVAAVVAVPVAMRACRARGISPVKAVIAIALIANATSFLLPTSNLTNLLVLTHAPMAPAPYVESSWLAWLLVTGFTISALTLLLCNFAQESSGNRLPSCRLASIAARRAARESACPTMQPPEAREAIAPRLGAASGDRDATMIAPIPMLLDLAPLFLLATAIRALFGGTPALPGSFLSGFLVASGLAALFDNLPVASALTVTGSTGRWTAILALTMGPNILLTGSLATLICRRIARQAGAAFNPLAFSLLGASLLPFQVLLAYTGLRLTGGI